MKPENVKIIDISTATPHNGGVSVYGLGDDGMVYLWDAGDHKWFLWG